MIYVAVLHYKRNEINGIEFFSWVSIWCVTILIIIFPEILRSFAKSFFITRLFDFLVVGGFILVISMSLKAYLSSKKTERKIEELVRKEALGSVGKQTKAAKNGKLR